MTPLELLVVVWITLLIVALFALAVAYLFDLRDDPPEWWVRRHIPDFVPDDWHGGDRRENSRH